MNVTVAQHVPYEGPGMIAAILADRGHRIEYCYLWENEDLPTPASVDAWISMGGPMSARDAAELPWIAAEQELLAALHEQKTPILGVCLGAQQIGAALGGSVERSPEREIGWFPIQADPRWSAFIDAPTPPAVLHWHGEMVRPPAGSIPLATSAGCPQQGFFFADQPTLGLQFHVEMDPRSLNAIIAASSEELAVHRGEPWVTDAQSMRESAEEMFPHNQRYLESILAWIGF